MQPRFAHDAVSEQLFCVAALEFKDEKLCGNDESAFSNVRNWNSWAGEREKDQWNVPAIVSGLKKLTLEFLFN